MSSNSTFPRNETTLPDDIQSTAVTPPQGAVQELDLQFDPNDKSARVLMVDFGLPEQISAYILNDISYEVKYSENEGEAMDEDGSARYERRETLVETLARVLYESYVAPTQLSATVDFDRWMKALDGIIWGVLIDRTANWFTGNGEQELEFPILDPSEQVPDEIVTGRTTSGASLPAQDPYLDEFSNLNQDHDHSNAPIESHAPLHDAESSRSFDFTPGLDNIEMDLDTPNNMETNYDPTKDMDIDTPRLEAPILTLSRLRPRYIPAPVSHTTKKIVASKQPKTPKPKPKPSPQAQKKQKGKGSPSTARRTTSRSVKTFLPSSSPEPVIILDQYMQVIERVCIHITIQTFHHKKNCLIWLAFVPDITQFLFFAKKQSKLRFRGVDVIRLQVLNKGDLEEWLDIKEYYGNLSLRAKARATSGETETPSSFREILVENLIRRPGKVHDGYVTMVVNMS